MTDGFCIGGGVSKTDAKQPEARYGIDNDFIERSAAAYESGNCPHSDSPIHTGSHLEAAGTRRVTVVLACLARGRLLAEGPLR